LQDIGEYSAQPVPVDAIKKVCVHLGFPTNTVDDECVKIKSRN